MFRKLAATVAVSAALISPSWSLGLGEIDAESGLNQPLNAEITLISSSDVNEDDLRAKLASYESYNKFGVQREAYHNSLDFKIKTKNDGTKVIVVTSNDPVKEPFLNFLVELNWTQGRLLREYTVLLDPPVFSKTMPTPKPTATVDTNRPQTVTQNRQTPTDSSRRTFEPAEQEASTEVGSKVSRPVVDNQTRELASSAQFNGDDWTVERGQTLWSIAKAVRPEGVSVQQTLLAIFHNNPEAFINNDINRMKAGAFLKVPERSTIEGVSQAAAVNRIRNSTVTDDAPLDVRKSVEETEVDDSDTQGGRLSIASVDEGSSQDSSGSALDDDMSSDTGASDDASGDSASTANDSDVSEFDSDLSQSETASKSGLEVEDETLSVISGAADKADEDATKAEDEDTYLAQDKTTDVNDSNMTGGVTDESNAVTSQESKTADSDAQPTNSLLNNTDKAFYEADNFWLYTGAGLVILLLIGGGFVYRRNLKVEEDDDGGLLDMMTATNKSKPKKKREPRTDNKAMDAPAEPKDPLSEADILIARGKLDKAENVLEDALAADPSGQGGQEVRVKLMEVVASQQNVTKFNQLKAELPDDFDHDSSLGLKVASLTSLIAPDEPEVRFDESPEMAFPSEEDIFGDEQKEPADLDLSGELETQGSESIDTVGNFDQPDSDNSLDMGLADFDEQVQQSSNDKKNADDNSIEFDTNQKDAAGLSDDDAATKFDLAKAYMELGDDEAARDILEEIKDEGNNSQRGQAEKLLSEL